MSLSSRERKPSADVLLYRKMRDCGCRWAGKQIGNLKPVMRMVRAYLCSFVPSTSASCNSGYNRLHGTFFAKGLAGRFCLPVVHLVLDGSCLSGCRGG